MSLWFRYDVVFMNFAFLFPLHFYREYYYDFHSPLAEVTTTTQRNVVVGMSV